MERVASGISSNSASALRVISTGAQVVGTLTGSPKLTVIGTVAQGLTHFLSAGDGGAGATTTDLAATASGQKSNAPTQEDLSSAPAPQLAETTDPIPETRPEVPETEFQTGIQNRFYDPLGSPDTLLNEIATQILQDAEMENWDPEEIEEMLVDIENQLMNVKRFIVGGSDQAPIKVKQKSVKLQIGKFVPV